MNKSVFVFEYVSGGGFNKTKIPSPLFSEGFAMLKSICEDFKLSGFQVYSVFDYRIKFLIDYVKVDYAKVVYKDDNFISIFKELTRKSDYAFIIAPESENILYNLTSIVKNLPTKLLSNELEAIKLGTSKLLTYQFFLKNNLPTPSTMKVDFNDNLSLMNFTADLSKPLILKPLDGVGSEQVYFFNSNEDFESFLKDPPIYFDKSRAYVIQEFVSGRDMSTLLLSNSPFLKNAILILGVSNQRILLQPICSNLRYLGGDSPVFFENEGFYHLLYKKLNKIDFSKFHSFFGIDFISTKECEISLIELNPRLTTSYIGIRNVIDFNPVSLLLSDACGFNNLERLEPKFHSIFMPLEFHYFGERTVDEVHNELLPEIIRARPEIVTPLISLDQDRNNRCFSCFISTKSIDFSNSQSTITDLIKYLEIRKFMRVT